MTKLYFCPHSFFFSGRKAWLRGCAVVQWETPYRHCVCAMWEHVCDKDTYCITSKPTLLLIAHCALPHIPTIHILVLFLSLVVTVTYARTSSLTHQYKHIRRVRRLWITIVTFQQEIPSARVACVCLMGVGGCAASTHATHSRYLSPSCLHERPSLQTPGHHMINSSLCPLIYLPYLHLWQQHVSWPHSVFSTLH